MSNKLSFRPFAIPTVVLMLLGWGGLALLLYFTLPTMWPRWAFFLLIVMALTGTALPISFLMNQRFFSNGAVVIVRQSLLVGIYAALMMWLQLGRLLTFSMALWFVLGFLGVEYLLQLRERSKLPKEQEEE